MHFENQQHGITELEGKASFVVELTDSIEREPCNGREQVDAVLPGALIGIGKTKALQFRLETGHDKGVVILSIELNYQFVFGLAEARDHPGSLKGVVQCLGDSF